MGCGASQPEESTHAVRQMSAKTKGAEVMFLAELEVMAGEGIPDMDIGGGADPFVVVSFGRHTFRTTTCKRCQSPKWEQLVYFFVTDLEKGFKLFIELYDEDTTSANDHISSADISLSKLLSSSEPTTLSLSTPSGGAGGSITIRMKPHYRQDIERLYWSYVFKMFDVNEDGALDKEEVEVVLNVVGQGDKQVDVDKLFTALDSNDDNRVSASEFCDFMLSKDKLVSLLPADVRSPPFMRDIIKQLQSICANDAAIPMSIVDEKDTDIVWVLGLFLFQSGVGVFGDKVTQNPVQKLILSESYAMTAHGAAGVEDTAHTSDKEGANLGTKIFFQNRMTGRMEKEAIPSYVRFGMEVMYGAKPQLAAGMLKRFTKVQATKYDKPESVKDIPTFVDFHNIDTSEMERPMEEYKTFNQFFYRKLKAGARPIASGTGPYVVVCPADARTLVFESFDNARALWVKGRSFSVAKLIDDEELVEKLGADPQLCVSRLAPQDYHRFHAACRGTISKISPISGEYYTVNPVAVRSKISVFTENTRVIVEVESPDIGTVVYVAIGATLVGSVNLTLKVGDTMEAGDDLGYFAFGGSTVVTVFKQNAITFERDLLKNSTKPTETLTRMGQPLATVRPLEP